MAPRRTFTVKEKVDIISRLEKGENNVDLCKQFGVSHSTISTMWKNRAKILKCFETKSLKIKKNRNPTHQDIENALLMWFKAQRSQNVPISGPLLQEKANHFARQLGKTNFECSGSWIYRFRQRHDIVVGKVCGEPTSVSQNGCDHWLSTVLPKLTEGYTDSQIWNADETGLFFKLTPDRTLKFKGKKCAGGKLSKDRITVLVASSMAGEKRILLVIWKAKKPRCFKNVKTLPVDCEANQKAWMTSEIFEKVLRKWDSQLRGNKKEIILFINNCPGHPQIQNFTNIKLAFLPPNTTSLIQPNDQGITKNPKNHYRKYLSRLSSTVTNWETYVNNDDQVITTDNLTDNEIIESVLQTKEKEDEEEEENCNPCEIPTTRDAICALTTLKKYCLFGDGQSNLDVEAIMKMEYTLQRAQKKIT